MTEKTRFAYLLAFPAVVMVLLIVMYPLLNGIWLSFHDRYLLSPNMPFVGLKNYITLTNDQEFIKSFSITIVWVILATLIQFVVGMAIALLLHEATWGKSIFRSLILLPWAIPTIVSAILWRWMYNDLYGVINYILNSLGLINEYLPWLGATKTALIAVIIAYCWRSLPFMVLVILAGLQSISDDLYESAAIDGARADQSFRYITLPGLRPVITIGLLLTAIWSFQEFPMVWMMTYGGPSAATEILAIHIYLKAFISSDFGYGASMATVMFIVIFIFSIIYVRTYGREDL